MTEDKILKRFDEHREWAERRFNQIDNEIRALNQFRWRVTGGAAVFSAVLAGLYEIIKNIQSLTFK